MEIRKSRASDTDTLLSIHQTAFSKAFGKEEGPVTVDLVTGLFADKTAAPLLSLVAEEKNQLVGHLLFTNVDILQAQTTVSARLLAPIAVLPEVQKTGIGGKLINYGLKQLKLDGVDLVFVLGHPEYYPRFGFIPAGKAGFKAPYPIPEADAAAWMVQELKAGLIGSVTGQVQCADVLNQPQHWS